MQIRTHAASESERRAAPGSGNPYNFIMPIYEYICEQDGTTLELMRPMAEADAPVPDPEGKGRVFKRIISAPNARTSVGGSAGGVSLGTCCPCGKPGGGCGGGGRA